MAHIIFLLIFFFLHKINNNKNLTFLKIILHVRINWKIKIRVQSSGRLTKKKLVLEGAKVLNFTFNGNAIRFLTFYYDVAYIKLKK